ncbi:flagellar motor switch protein FliN [Halomonas binhaiensis]|uniref:Flagellar motor switch protein FliN n=1 Tax=Halomonas binhaiensis TaxID=2562282 RepID=A0A5C1NMS8_9GAMM|nr:flagellar motor switch protein FliN [Halomonas binhaiensis]QEM83823.1 flagellar motor switch protein FliN [Halomonas binhaiensis]
MTDLNHSELAESDTPLAEDDPWAEAMAEQASEASSNTDDSDASDNDASDNETDDGNTRNDATRDSVFRPLTDSAQVSQESTGPRDLEMVMDIPVKLTVELGRTRLTIKQLLELTQGSVVELEGLAGEPMDILINGYLIAQGEVVVVDDHYGIRITEIITPSERVQKLNR